LVCEGVYFSATGHSVVRSDGVVIDTNKKNNQTRENRQTWARENLIGKGRPRGGHPKGEPLTRALDLKKGAPNVGK